MTENTIYCYHLIIDLAVKLNLTLSLNQREELISKLLHQAAAEPDEPESLFPQGTVNYLRTLED